MSSKIRNCVRDLENSKNPKELLPEYVKQYMQLNSKYARVKMMMEYYLFYETVSEGINPYIASVKDTAEQLYRIVDAFFENELSKEETEAYAEELLKLRQGVVERMQVVTAYVDQFVVYEYILNRVQYRFEDLELLPEDSVFAQELVKFIFSTQDTATVNDNIRFALGQLPMRMTRSRYFELVKDSISVYKGSDKNSLDGFLYMFRTNAMLYRDENMERYFTEFVPVLEELSGLDYENISQELYEIYAEKIRINASKLNDISDLYMQLGQLINEMYAVCATAAFGEEGDKLDVPGLVIRGINSLFLQKDSDVWAGHGVEKTSSEEEKLYWLGEKLVWAEGKQEKLYDGMNMAGAALEGISESQKEMIAELGLTGEFEVLKNLFLLTSSSVFADLKEQSSGEKVTEKMAEEAAAALIAECKALFQGKSRMLRRAVMANTLEKMPVFFTSAQEVADYVMNSLSLCDDEAEKYASKQLLLEVIQ
ncbi:hypothetical protein D7V86_07160 [bacterium D16-51]|nr:hypothetical protein D7V96_04740 [bacterium D16-59]RKI60857.1 hypothetical protein D7V86_07160 [bacterium D16-51]